MTSNIKKANQLKKAKKYAEAIEIYESEFLNNPEEFTKWDMFNYSWAVYFNQIKNLNDFDEAVSGFDTIEKLITQADLNKTNTCAYTLSVMEILKYLSNNNEYSSVLYWLDKLNPDLLDVKQSSFNGRTYPSKREKYYTYASKAYFAECDFEECIKVSKKAISENFDSIWFYWRIAKSEKELGEYENALEALKMIESKNQDWFVSYEMAENYFFMMDNKNALKYAVKAALSPSKIDLKVKVYSLISDLIEDEYPDEALKHDYLTYIIRKVNGWPIDDDLISKIKSSTYNLEFSNYKKIEGELKPFWNKLKYINQPLHNGVVVKIFDHGGAGFIENDAGESFYFSMNDVCDKSDFHEFSSVIFNTEKRFNKSKGEDALNAVNIMVQQ